MTAKNNILIALLLMLAGLTHSGHAQQFKIKATLDSVRETGFYKIPVTPALSGYAKGDLSDIRIADNSNRHVPYINQKETSRIKPGTFTIFPILSNTTEGKYTTIVVENNASAGITDLSLIITNTAVERYTALSGSDDKNKWYIISDSILFHRSYLTTQGNYVQTITFPLTRYRYFKLRINNQDSDPLRIVDAGIFSDPTASAPPGFVNNPAPAFSQKDSSNHISYVTIKNPASYLTDRISLDIAGPKFYNRTAIAYIMHDAKDSANLTDPIASFTVCSDSSCYFIINSQKAHTIVLEISNKDNPPLKVTSVATSQQAQHLIAWLEKGKIYSLLAGDPNADAPQYDLSHFKNKVPEDIPTLSYGPLTPVSATAAPAAKPEKNYWLWPTIVGAVIVLSLLTYRLMKDVKQPGS